MDGSDLFGILAGPSPVPLHQDTRPLIVDSFAGGGGASTGIEMALGRSPDIAINHNAAALALHAANHPDTLHLSENVFRVDPLDHLQGRHIGLMWFSPDCKHFSKAKGGKPVERNIRDLAWIIPGWIDRLQRKGGRVDVVIMENVEEWKDWGPLVQTTRGLMPCPLPAWRDLPGVAEADPPSRRQDADPRAARLRLWRPDHPQASVRDHPL
jgi:DNA (cytosine-5)-methyltransferase 1